MSKENDKYDPKDKYEWGKGSFSVILEPHETAGLTDREISKLIDDRERDMEQAQDH